MKYQKLCKTLIRSRCHGIYWCAHKPATLTSIQHTVPPSKKIKKMRNQYAPIFARLVSRYSKKIAIHFKVWLQDYFGLHSLWPRGTIRPKEYLDPNNTLARYLFQPRNTSAKNNFGPIHFGPRTKFSKVSFLFNLGLP